MATHSVFLPGPMNRGAGQATVHEVAESQTQLSELAHVHFPPQTTTSMVFHPFLLKKRFPFLDYKQLVHNMKGRGVPLSHYHLASGVSCMLMEHLGTQQTLVHPGMSRNAGLFAVHCPHLCLPL